MQLEPIAQAVVVTILGFMFWMIRGYFRQSTSENNALRQEMREHSAAIRSAVEQMSQCRLTQEMRFGRIEKDLGTVTTKQLTHAERHDRTESCLHQLRKEASENFVRVFDKIEKYREVLNVHSEKS